MQGRRESVLERGHRELDDAGVDLANESADAHRADHKPWIGGEPREKRRRRWLGEFETQVQRMAPEWATGPEKDAYGNRRGGATGVLAHSFWRWRRSPECGTPWAAVDNAVTVYRDPWRPVLALPPCSAQAAFSPFSPVQMDDLERVLRVDRGPPIAGPSVSRVLDSDR
jgi:hypothetical protein